LLYQKLGVDYSLVGGFKPKAQKGILLSDTMRVSVVQSGREIDMMDEESESARNSRTRSLRRQLQANPAPESPSASQRLRAVEQGTPDSPIPELNTQMMTRGTRGYTAAAAAPMPFVPKELVTGVMSMADRWRHQVEENFQLKLILGKRGRD